MEEQSLVRERAVQGDCGPRRSGPAGASAASLRHEYSKTERPVSRLTRVLGYAIPEKAGLQTSYAGTSAIGEPTFALTADVREAHRQVLGLVLPWLSSHSGFRRICS